MQINRVLGSARVNPRIALAVPLCSAGMLLAIVSFASTPTSGTLTDSSGAVTWTGGPFVVSNATEQAGAPICKGTGQDCDDFALNVNVTTDPTKKVKVAVQWPLTTPISTCTFTLPTGGRW